MELIRKLKPTTSPKGSDRRELTPSPFIAPQNINLKPLMQYAHDTIMLK